MKLQVCMLILANAIVLIRTAAIPDQIDENSVVENGDDEDLDKKKCPPWDKWQASKCLWPTQKFSTIPDACTSLPKKPEIPSVLKQFIRSKEQEVYSFVQNVFKLRGAKAACGHCSRKIRCRQRKGGEFKEGCKFIDAQIVDEECEGSEPCQINAILGACPPPIPIAPPPPKRHHPDSIDLIDQSIDLNKLSDHNLEIAVGKNASQGPPFWNCARDKNGTKCLCCCGWYFPNANTGKCVNIRKDDEENDNDQIWNWSGLLNIDPKFPFGIDNAIVDNRLIEQIEAPPAEIESPINNEPETAIDQIDQEPMERPNPPGIDPTAHQVAAPFTENVPEMEKPEKLKKLREINEI